MKKILSALSIISFLIITTLFAYAQNNNNNFIINNITYSKKIKFLSENINLKKEEKKKNVNVLNEKIYIITSKEKTLYATEDITVKKKFGINSEDLGVIKKGESISQYGECNNNWIQISFNNNIGYIENNNITETPPFNEIIYNNTTYVNSTNTKIDLAGLDFSGVSTDIQQIAINYWSQIPEYYRQSFINDGWTLHITNSAVEDMYNYSFPIIGLTVYDEKNIWVEANESAIRRSLCHEFGHYWDYKNGFVSQTASFLNIYEQEKYTFNEQDKVDNHCIGSSMEYYAEIFAQGILYYNTCQPSAPSSYDFIF